MKYLKLFENIDFDKINNDLDFLPIEDRFETIMKLQRIIDKKAKDTRIDYKNYKTNIIKNELKDFIEFCKLNIKSNFLKNIFIDLNNYDGFKITANNINLFNKTSIFTIYNKYKDYHLFNNEINLNKIEINFSSRLYNFNLSICQSTNKDHELFYNITLYAYPYNDEKLKQLRKKYHNVMKLNKNGLLILIDDFKNDLNILNLEIISDNYNL